MTSSICTCLHHLNFPSLMTLTVTKSIEQKTSSVGIQPPIRPYQWTRENTSNSWLDWYRVSYVVFRLVFLAVPVCLYCFLFDIFCFLKFFVFFSFCKLHTRQQLILRKGFCLRMMENQSSVIVLFHVTVVGWSIMCLWFIAIYSLFYSLHILIYASCWYLMFVLFQSSSSSLPFTPPDPLKPTILFLCWYCCVYFDIHPLETIFPHYVVLYTIL